MKRNYLHILVTLLALLLTPVIYAQDKIESDRSDEAEGAKTLGAGGIQAEAGAYIVNFKSGPSALVGDFSFHYGLFKQVNLVAVVQEGRERVRFMSETSQGFFPLALGTKVAVLRETQHCPAVSMSAYIQLPFNARTESEAIHWSKAFNLIAEKELFNKKWNVLANIGLQQPSNGRRYQLQTVEVVSYHGFEKVAFMAEHFAAYDPKDRPQNNLGIGLSYFLTYNLQLDISGSSTIGSAMANKCLSTGLAVRL